MGSYEIGNLAPDHLLGKELLYTIAQLITASILSTENKAKTATKSFLGHVLPLNSIQSGNTINLLRTSGRGA